MVAATASIRAGKRYASAVTLFGIGLLKGKIAETNLLRSGIETFVLGSVAAALGFAVGTLLPKAFGVHVPAA